MVPAIAVAAFFIAQHIPTERRHCELSRCAYSRHGHRRQYFIFHLLGDVPSPTPWVLSPIGIRSKAAFILPVIAMAISSAILFYGMRFAPPVQVVNRERVGAHSG